MRLGSTLLAFAFYEDLSLWVEDETLQLAPMEKTKAPAPSAELAVRSRAMIRAVFHPATLCGSFFSSAPFRSA
jgi:hypothetical protein